MSFKEIMEEQLFDADKHTKNESIRQWVTVEKAIELHVSMYWE